MSFFSLRSLLMILAMPLITAIKSAEKDPNTLVRKNFFSDITGMNEKDFRTKFGWKDARPSQSSLWHLTQLPDGSQYSKENAKSWLVKQHKRSAAIFQGTLQMLKIKDLKKLPEPPSESLRKPPRLHVVVFNPANPQAADVRTLQADAQNKNAVFQVASTLWGPLEGGMFNPNAFLTSMIKRAVQGEEASISAAPATIFRKYFLPTQYVETGYTGPGNLYLLKHLSKKLPMDLKLYKNTGEAQIQYIDRSLADNDFDNILLALHDNIVVSSGYGGKGMEDQQTRLPIYVKKDGTIDTNRTQIISQVFTAALNLGEKYYVHPESLSSQEKAGIITKLTHLLLSAAYKGTLMAAIYAQKSKVFFTLMGGGAFRNPIASIDNAIFDTHDPANWDLITKYGLDVTLVYHPDRPNRENPVRNKGDDTLFLTNMAIAAAFMNDQRSVLQDEEQYKNKQYETIIQNYVYQAYDPKRNEQSFISAAQKVQELFDVLAKKTQPAPSRPTVNLDTLYSALTNLTSNLTALQNKLAGK